MHPSRFRPFTSLSVLLLVLAWGAVTPAQETNRSLEQKQQQLQLEQQQLELEKKQLELRRQQLQLEDAARRELQLKETSQAVTMQLQGDVLFDFGQATLKPAAERTLDTVGTVIAQFPTGQVLIEGYTDSRGAPDVNLALSQRRAEAVKDWLVHKKGIPAASITTRGLGETKPVAPNTQPDGSDNPAGRQQNRRVAITVEKR